MSTIQVQGLRSLKGEIEIQGSKNAVLPMMAAAILHNGTTVITNVPRIQDVFCMMGILEYMGCVCHLDGHELTIDAQVLTATTIPEDYVTSMRSSIMILGALLGRAGEAITTYPGGCSIGKRPIDLHLHALRTLGAVITEEGNTIRAEALQLVGASVDLTFPSVGATENALLAAVLAYGITVIHGAAREPEIEELCLFLNNMGAQIGGIGTGCLTITGAKSLHDSSYRVVGDRIVAGTYLAAVMAGTGHVTLCGVNSCHMQSIYEQVSRVGAVLTKLEDTVTISAYERPKSVNIHTGPYPEFPTDMQSPMLALMSIASGSCMIEETIFEARFETAKELKKMGADIIIEEKKAFVRGTYPLKGGLVRAMDLRGGAALVVAGLASEGITEIEHCSHIFRGYENICQDLSDLGALITYQCIP